MTVKAIRFSVHIPCVCTRASTNAQLCLAICDLMYCSLPGSSIHGIFQGRILEWGAIAFMANRWGNNGNSARLFFGAPKSLQMVIAAMKLKDAYSLEGKL